MTKKYHESVEIDERRGVIDGIVSTIKTSRILQIAIFALVLALSIAIIKGYNVSIFGIEVSKPVGVVINGDSTQIPLDHKPNIN